MGRTAEMSVLDLDCKLLCSLAPVLPSVMPP